jgi:hypothetical protein
MLVAAQPSNIQKKKENLIQKENFTNLENQTES